MRRLQGKTFANLIFIKGMIADNIDLANLGALAFSDFNSNLNLVQRQFFNLGIDHHAVLAARVVLVGEIALNFVKR